jgi:phosphatidylethanolamine-binding protein (PEBP) family uncharacterized protein
MSSTRLIGVSGILLVGVLTACSSEEEESDASTTTFAVTSPAFAAGGAIPAEYTCDTRPFPVALTNPELNWTEGPTGTKSYAIVVKHLAIVEGLDPSDPNYFKGFMWAIWDIPSTVHKLPTNLSRDAAPADIPGAQQWSIRNQFGYFAPCPNADPATVAADPTTRVNEEYGFTVYALNTDKLPLPAKEADVANYAWTITKYLDSANIGSVTLRATSDAVSSAAPTPVDMAALVYPVPVP